jgi:ABC-2 type transport system ATP-binding protein
VYGPRAAVRDLSLTVPRGSIFGFLGPNGAGKSTSIKMLLGLVKPTSGQAFVLGVPSGDVDVRRHIGFLPEDFRFYEWLTAIELLELHGRLSGVPAGTLRQRAPGVLDLVGLTKQRDTRLQHFSKGMLQRVGLAQALIHEPDLIFLDEPTSGLDPMGRRLVRDVIRAQRERGATIFLNSHLLSEVEVTCDRVAFIKDGEVVAIRDMDTLAGHEIRVVVRGGGLSAGIVAGLDRWIAGAHLEGERLTFTTRDNDVLPEIVRALVSARVDVYEVTPTRLSLEELFVSIMGEDQGG